MQWYETERKAIRDRNELDYEILQKFKNKMFEKIDGKYTIYYKKGAEPIIDKNVYLFVNSMDERVLILHNGAGAYSKFEVFDTKKEAESYLKQMTKEEAKVKKAAVKKK